MNKIEIKVLNPSAISDVRDMAVVAARLTQRAEKIENMSDFMTKLYKPYSDGFVETICNLPHPTLQKFGIINIVIVGASRRFLAQITRHQNEVKFMSGSLQYSDYSNDAQFVVPYEIMEADQEANMLHKQHPEIVAFDNPFSDTYIQGCRSAMNNYKNLCTTVGNDAAGYAAPQGLRNVLIISATPYQFKHMISQRSCNRNTKETQYVMLRCWEELYALDKTFFADCGPACLQTGNCPENKMCCGHSPCSYRPYELLNELFPLLRRVNNDTSNVN